MKIPFSFEAANDGKPFENTDGLKGIEFRTLGFANKENQLVVVFENGTVGLYDLDGKKFEEQRLFMSQEDLKPCPFCGYKNLELSRNEDDYYSIICPRCYVGTAIGERQETIASWNRRSEPVDNDPWQPIKTAPKDGSYVWLAKNGEVLPYMGYWDKEHGKWMAKGGFHV